MEINSIISFSPVHKDHIWITLTSCCSGWPFFKEITKYGHKFGYPWLSLTHIYGTTNVFRHFFRKTFLPLGIWDYSYKSRGVISKSVDSKIAYKLLIKNLTVLSWVKTLTKKNPPKYKYMSWKIKSEWIASFCDGI